MLPLHLNIINLKPFHHHEAKIDGIKPRAASERNAYT